MTKNMILFAFYLKGNLWVNNPSNKMQGQMAKVFLLLLIISTRITFRTLKEL